MKLISLNIWGGKVFGPLASFLKEQASTTDIFCFQEVFQEANKAVYEGARLNIFSEISQIIPESKGYFSPCQDNFGLGCFVKNRKAEVEDAFVYGELNSMVEGNTSTLPRNIQSIRIPGLDKKFTVFNYHGIWRPGSKDDDADRIATSEKIKSIMKKSSGEKILCGDFNLLPDTKSLGILEDGMTNLIKQFNIKSTRSTLYTKEHKFADYMIVSKGVKVKDYKVPEITVSDHLPMILEFEL